MVKKHIKFIVNNTINGAACPILFERIMGKDDYVVELISMDKYYNADQYIQHLIKSKEINTYDNVYIVDILASKYTMKYIDEYNLNNKYDKIKLYCYNKRDNDKYNWAKIKSDPKSTIDIFFKYNISRTKKYGFNTNKKTLEWSNKFIDEVSNTSFDTIIRELNLPKEDIDLFNYILL